MEVSFKRVLKLARRLARSGIRNIRLVEGTGEETVRELLHVPDRYTLVSLIACGYSDDKPKPVKKPVEEVTFREKFGS